MLLNYTATRKAPLLSILRQEMQLSSSLVKRLKWQDALLINGTLAHTNAIVLPGDVVCVDLRERVVGYEGEAGSLRILYEDACCLAVDKPAGLLVHPSTNKNSGTLANQVLGYYQRTGQACGVHPVTRLDRDTFGVVLLAKNAYVHDKFCKMQKAHQIQKTYQASVYSGRASSGSPAGTVGIASGSIHGRPWSAHGVIDLPISKRPGRSLLRTIDPNGKESRTIFTVLARYSAYSVLELQPITGRTHQLRLHCWAGGFPILGDPQYFSEESYAFSEENGLRSQQLCAKKIEFPHPMTGELISIESQQNVWTEAGSFGA